MVQTVQSGTYTNLYGVPVGQPLRSPFNPKKHLEKNSFNAVIPQEHQWLGIINTIQNFTNVKMPFLSMTELQKNVIEVDGAGSTLQFGVPFQTGCPYLLENLVTDNPTPGKYNQPFFIVLSENSYTHGDVLTSDYRNGKQIRVQNPRDKGPEAEILPYGNGYRYMVALDGIDEEDYYPQEFLIEGTAYMKIDNPDGGEFETNWTTVGGEPRSDLQMYAYTIGHSDRKIHGWVTSDASHKTYNFESAPGIPALSHLKNASTDVLEYFFEDSKTKMKTGVFWVPQFIEKMAAELAKMQEKALLWSQGRTFVSNGRERIITGLGFYQQIKQRGNYDTYSTFDQLFNLIENFSERLFTFGNHVPVAERIVKIRAGKLAYSELRKRFKQYFVTDNPFTVMADHPALIKAKMLNWDDKYGMQYTPIFFDSIFFPEQGRIFIEHDPTFDDLDSYLEHPKQGGYGSLTSGMVIVENISSDDFTNYIPANLRKSDANYRNVSLVKHKGKEDTTEYLVGQGVSSQLKAMLGLPKNLISSHNKKLEIVMGTHGEVFVHDPSKVWIIEFDPYGDIAFNNRNISLYKPL